MTTKTSEVLERLETAQDALIRAVGAQGTVLRTISAQLDELLERLAPRNEEGPTLQDLLAALVSSIGDHGILLRQIDRRTEAMAHESQQNGGTGRQRHGASFGQRPPLSDAEVDEQLGQFERVIMAGAEERGRRS